MTNVGLGLGPGPVQTLNIFYEIIIGEQPFTLSAARCTQQLL